ncbi:MAG: class I SAM-dependent methyltransferase [Longimicrobiales bacterium]
MAAETSREEAAGEGFEPQRYGSWFETELGRIVWEDELDALLGLLGPVEGKRLLDAGVGEGRLALDPALAGADVTGVDVSLPMLRAARQRSLEARTFLHLAAADLKALPFRSASFDRVVAMTVLCFVENPQVAVNEMARVLKPGGRLVIGELGRWSLWAAIRRLRGLLGNTLWRHARFWTLESVERLVARSGLIPVGRESAVFYPPSAGAARVLRPVERVASARGVSMGAAFLAVAAKKL